MANTRRAFLEFLGRSAAFGGLAGHPLFTRALAGEALPFKPVMPTRADAVVVADGFKASVLISDGRVFGAKGERFGANNDFLAFVPMTPGKTDDGLLWVNHEEFTPLFTSGYAGTGGKTKEQVDLERAAVGGSIVRIRKATGSTWEVVEGDPRNRRLDATTPIPLVADRAIAGSHVAIGTLANCSGGQTPWRTVLSAEENYQSFYGEVNPSARNARNRIYGDNHLGWDHHYDVPPEHYGWMVEIDPFTGGAKKLTALGRFSHEGALIETAPDGRAVAYMGDDAADQFIYKFVSRAPNSLENGELYVADTVKGEWISLSWHRQAKLRHVFADQTDVLIHARRAGQLMGATPQDRPEGMARDPVTGDVLVALTNNKDRKNFHGQIMRLTERDGDPRSLRFHATTFAAGGPSSGFSCPDNLAFDARGDLWMTSDMSAGAMGTDPYTEFGNNGLFYLPLTGPDAGKAIQVASAPKDAEFTGPCFSPDGRQLFLSVQHPGEGTKDLAAPTSRWPTGDVPRSSVIVLSGGVLDRATRA